MMRCNKTVRTAAVLASVHQKAFCESLGLDVIATFSAADTAGVGQLDHAVRAAEAANIRAIIANQPEGRRTADARSSPMLQLLHAQTQRNGRRNRKG